MAAAATQATGCPLPRVCHSRSTSLAHFQKEYALRPNTKRPDLLELWVAGSRPGPSSSCPRPRRTGGKLCFGGDANQFQHRSRDIFYSSSMTINDMLLVTIFMFVVFS